MHFAGEVFIKQNAGRAVILIAENKAAPVARKNRVAVDEIAFPQTERGRHPRNLGVGNPHHAAADAAARPASETFEIA